MDLKLGRARNGHLNGKIGAALCAAPIAEKCYFIFYSPDAIADGFFADMALVRDLLIAPASATKPEDFDLLICEAAVPFHLLAQLSRKL